MERFFRSDIWCSIRLDFSNTCLILGPTVFDFVLEEGLGGGSAKTRISGYFMSVLKSFFRT